MRWLKRHVLKPVVDTFTHFGTDDGYLLAAGVAYYVGLSFFPLLMVLIAGFGWFLRFTYPGQDAEQRVLEVVEYNFSEGMRTQVAQVFDHFEEHAGYGGPIGVAILLFTAGTIFAQFERAFDRIWRFTPPEDMGWIATIKSLLIERLTAFVLLIGVGALVVLTFVAGIALDSIQKFADQYLPLPRNLWNAAQFAVTTVINTVAFGVLYHTLPRARVKWKEAFRGGLVIAIVWEIGRQVLAAFLIGDRYSAYGLVGALLAIQLWAYYSVTIILLGAEYVRVTCEHCTGEAAAEMNRRRFWQLMTKMYTRKSGTTVSPPVTQAPDGPARPATKAEGP